MFVSRRGHRVNPTSLLFHPNRGPQSGEFKGFQPHNEKKCHTSQ